MEKNEIEVLLMATEKFLESLREEDDDRFNHQMDATDEALDALIKVLYDALRHGV